MSLPLTAFRRVHAPAFENYLAYFWGGRCRHETIWIATTFRGGNHACYLQHWPLRVAQGTEYGATGAAAVTSGALVTWNLAMAAGEWLSSPGLQSAA
jgi:hypothetical protein